MREKCYKKQSGYRVAITGHRGIPNSYGGFETLAEELSSCLIGLGAEVVVYCRKNYFSNRPPEYKSASLIYLPTITRKVLDTFVHTFLSILHVIFKNTADVLIIVNVGNAPLALIAKLLGKKVIFCVDGLDWQRKKWGAFARLYLKLCSYLAPFAAHEIVTDAGSVQEFYKSERGADSALIPYGTDIDATVAESGVLAELGLEHKKYFIYVARFEPENNPLSVVQSYVKSGSKLPLVMIGDNRYNKAYTDSVMSAANKNVIFLGYVFGARYKELVKSALAYVRAAEVGGASPAIIEAMGRNVCVVANDKPENREIVGETGLFYNLLNGELVGLFKTLTGNPDRAIGLGQHAGQRAMLLYSWDKIAYEYFKLIRKLSAVEEINAVKNTYAGLKGQKILITGAGGMLGQAVYEHFSKNYDVKATDIDVNEPWLERLDVRDFSAFEKAVSSFRPKYIFHLAALTSLENCERERANAYATNALSAKYAAQLATRWGAKLVYISSAGVFDGQKQAYLGTDEPNPINVYGLTKQMGSLLTEYYARDYLTIRPGWMMGGGPRKDKKFVASIVRQLVSGSKELHAVTDKRGTPTYTRDLAKNLELLLKADARGTYNMVCGGSASRYDVAYEIVKILGYAKQTKVMPVDSSYFAHTYFANRPHYENLINDRLEKEGMNVMQPWRKCLKEYLEADFAYAFKEQNDAVTAKVAQAIQ